jgi:uncharacterized protein (TIGR00290 family)
MRDKVLFSWSGGKDCSLGLYSLRQNRLMEITSLLTVVTAEQGRVSMHGVSQELVERQAEAIECPLETIVVSRKTSSTEYEEKLQECLERHKSKGVTLVAFGDIFLEDLKKYRESSLARIGMKGLFPLWQQKSLILARRFIELKFTAIVTCVDGQKLDGKFCGRTFDASFLADLPEGVDPCGENGEFHTFVVGGPIFKKPLPVSVTDVVVRDEQFYYADLR